MSTQSLSAPAVSLGEQPPKPGSAVRFMLRTLWFVVVPGLMALLALRFFVPDALHAASDPLSQFLAKMRADFAVPLGALVFLASAFVLRYWRAYLPGGVWLLADPKGAPERIGVTVWLLIAAVLIALFIRSSVFTSYRILSASMVPTLEQDDQVAVDKAAYGLRLPGAQITLGRKLPRRGDVVVFRAPDGQEGPPELIKRVVGLPGDIISMQGGHVVINGWQAPSCEAGPYPYLSRDYSSIARIFVEFLNDRIYLATFVPFSEAWNVSFRVPAGEVFVLGDNRSSSEDSRAWNHGKGAALPAERIVGRADRMVVGSHRNAAPDFSQLLKPLDWYEGRPLNLEGVDTTKLRAAIDRCVSQRPKNTVPPPATLPTK